jgi:23S rRNA (cytidine1920-2'-O)/16S rRNA (cytidine1409-2'-O)-methyltransferase
MNQTKKKRLDQLVAEQFPQLSRTYISSLIMQGKVKVDDIVITKSGTSVSSESKITCDVQEPKYVGRAGFKLEKALDEFGIAVEGLVAMDAGISTGGFTDCLLQRGVAKVYGVDVGYGQTHEKVTKDPRLVLMERTNLRTLSGLPELLDIVTLDVSFISVLKVIDVVARLLKPQGKLVVLIKPQFEAGKCHIGRGGIVTDPAVHAAVVDAVVKGICQHGFQLQGVIDSPIKGADGNKEFLAYFIGA